MSTQANRAVEEPDWKDRYYQALNDFEEQEKNWGHTEDELYKSILRLIFSYKGFDTELDQKLSDMRSSLQKEKGREARNAIISPLINDILQFSQRDEGKAADRIELKNDDPLTQLLDNLSLPGDLGIEILALRKRAAQIEQEQERLQLIQDLVEVLSSRARQTDEDQDGEQGFPHLKETMLELFEWLSIPDDYRKRVESVKNKINTLQADADLSAVLRDTAIVINDLQEALQLELGDIQGFLLRVTARLEDVEDCFRELEGAETQTREETRQLNDKIHDNVRSIRTGITESSDVLEMKKNIESRLTFIEQSVGNFLHSNEERQQKWEERVSTLKQRLNSMRGETVKLQKRIHEEYKKAKTDALTGIANRLAYNAKIKHEFARWQRSGQPFSLCVIDVDKFKPVNDTWGHKAGDKVLKTIAEVCAINIRKTDFFARYGGEEFVLLLPETAIDQAQLVAENLRKAVEVRKFHYAKEPVPVTISCGLAQIREGDTMGEVFQRADKAMYSAKQNGRNQVALQH